MSALKAEAERFSETSVFVQQNTGCFTPEKTVQGVTPEKTVQGVTPEKTVQGVTPEKTVPGVTSHKTVEFL